MFTAVFSRAMKTTLDTFVDTFSLLSPKLALAKVLFQNQKI